MQQLHIARSSSSSIGGRIFDRLKFNEMWTELYVKYDPGNWFLLAQSKSSSLFKYFCCASSDAMFPVEQGAARYFRLALE